MCSQFLFACLFQSLLDLKDRFDHFLNNSFNNDRLFKQAISSVSLSKFILVHLVVTGGQLFSRETRCIWFLSRAVASHTVSHKMRGGNLLFCGTVGDKT